MKQCPGGEYWMLPDKFREKYGDGYLAEKRRKKEIAQRNKELVREASIRAAKAREHRLLMADELARVKKERKREYHRKYYAALTPEQKLARNIKKREDYHNNPGCREYNLRKCRAYQAKRKKEREPLEYQKKLRVYTRAVLDMAVKEWKRMEREERAAFVRVRDAIRDRDKKPVFRLTDEQRKERRRDEKRNYKHRRRARLRNMDAKVTPSEIRQAMKKAKGVCFYCKEKVGKLTIDHVVPIAGGGSHTLDNIVFACHGCNSEKRDLPAHEFASQFGMLLV